MNIWIQKYREAIIYYIREKCKDLYKFFYLGKTDYAPPREFVEAEVKKWRFCFSGTRHFDRRIETNANMRALLELLFDDHDKYHSRLVLSFSPNWQRAILGKIQAEAERIIAAQKPAFELKVRTFRKLIEILAQEPIMELSSVLKEEPRGQRTHADMRNEKTKELAGLPNRIAYVAIGSRGDRFAPRMETIRLPEAPAWVSAAHREQALRNAHLYTATVEDIESQVQKRREGLRIAPPPVIQPVQEEKKHDAPVPLHVAKRRVYAASNNGYLPTLPVPDDTLSKENKYLMLLYHFHYLTVEQICKLLGKTGKYDVTHVREDLNDLVGEVVGKGLITKEKITGNVQAGRVPLVYSLTQRGIERLEAAFGVSAGTRKGTFSEHTLLVSDALIACVQAAKMKPFLRLVGLKHERTFAQQKIPVAGGFLQPDGFLQFQLTPPFGVENESIGVCLEIDLAHETRPQWQEKVQKYMSFASGVYQEQFGLESLTIAVCCPRENSKLLKTWTKEELEVQDKREYAPLFVFTDSNPADSGPVEWVTSPVWTDIDNTPYALIEKIN